MFFKFFFHRSTVFNQDFLSFHRSWTWPFVRCVNKPPNSQTPFFSSTPMPSNLQSCLLLHKEKYNNSKTPKTSEAAAADQTTVSEQSIKFEGRKTQKGPPQQKTHLYLQNSLCFCIHVLPSDILDKDFISSLRLRLSSLGALLLAWYSFSDNILSSFARAFIAS